MTRMTTEHEFRREQIENALAELAKAQRMVDPHIAEAVRPPRLPRGMTGNAVAEKFTKFTIYSFPGVWARLVVEMRRLADHREIKKVAGQVSHKLHYATETHPPRRFFDAYPLGKAPDMCRITTGRQDLTGEAGTLGGGSLQAEDSSNRETLEILGAMRARNPLTRQYQWEERGQYA